MGDKRILQRELPFFLLLRWKYNYEKWDQMKYLESCQTIISGEISKDRYDIMNQENTTALTNLITEKIISMTSEKEMRESAEIWYQKQWELYLVNKFKRQRRIYRHLCFLAYVFYVLSIGFYFVLPISFIYNSL